MHATPEPETSAPTVAALRRAVTLGLLAHRSDLGARIDALLGAAPDDPEAWLLRGFGTLFLGCAARRPSVAELARRVARDAPPRERRLAAALGAWADDDPNEALRTFESLLEADPNDAVVAKLEHGLLFVLGRSRAMRARMERVVAARDPDRLGHGHLLGCLAFAHVETGDLEGAHRLGLRALELAPDDAWGAHAVAHVFEHLDDPTRGLAHLDAFRDATAGCGVFTRHVEWHRAVFLVELGRLPSALAIYDACLVAGGCENYRDVSNCASLLWYVEREGLDVGDRWARLAEGCEPLLDDGGSGFAMVHRALALLRAGHDPRSRLAELSLGLGHQSEVVREVALPIVNALSRSLLEGDASGAVTLRKLRNEIARLGGSGAQRDVFERLSIDLAFDAGATPFAKALVEARLEGRPRNAFARRRKWVQRPRPASAPAVDGAKGRA